MEISGKIIQFLEPQTGEGKNGPWKKQQFIIETQEQYPKKVCIMVWGDKINLQEFNIEDVVTVSINIESREFNQRWYTDVKAWRIVPAQPVSPPQENRQDPLPPAPDFDDYTDDLPF